MGLGKIKGAYLAATMASILFKGGLAPAIGILGEGELGGEGVREGAAENEPLMGVGNKRGFKEKANELKSADVSFCTGVVKIGAGRSSVVLAQHQGTVSGEEEVTKSCPSGPGPGEENSTGTLPKFRKREATETGMSNN
jgi:hypothetical protein